MYLKEDFMSSKGVFNLFCRQLIGQLMTTQSSCSIECEKNEEQVMK
jgi:hypothetical protein